MNADSGKFCNLGYVEVRHVQEGRLVEPLALYDHLERVHQVHRGLQVTFVRCNVNHTLKHANRLVKHALRIRVEVGDRQRTSIEVRLEEQIGLHVRAL